MSSYIKALAIDTKHLRVANNLANVYLAKGILNKAIELYLHAISVETANAKSYGD